MKRLIVLGVALCASSLAFAGPGKAGLWESTATVTFGQGGPQISPEMAAQMKARGIDLPFGRPMLVKVCVTPEMAAREEPIAPTRAQDSCHMENMNKSGSSFTGELVCNSDNMKGSGKINVSYTSSETYSGAFDFTGTGKNGQPVAMHNTFSGKWVSSDCGSVQPFSR